MRRTTEPAEDDPPIHLRLVSARPGVPRSGEEARPTKHILQLGCARSTRPPTCRWAPRYSHVSAACLLGLPIWDEELLRQPVQATRAGPGRTVRRSHLTVRAGRLDPDEITAVDGIAVTTVARTLVDLGRWATLESTVVCADAALRENLVSRADLDAALARAARSAGVARARIALSFADGGSAGVGRIKGPGRRSLARPTSAAVRLGPLGRTGCGPVVTRCGHRRARARDGPAVDTLTLRRPVRRHRGEGAAMTAVESSDPQTYLDLDDTLVRAQLSPAAGGDRLGGGRLGDRRGRQALPGHARRATRR